MIEKERTDMKHVSVYPSITITLKDQLGNTLYEREASYFDIAEEFLSDAEKVWYDKKEGIKDYVATYL